MITEDGNNIYIDSKNDLDNLKKLKCSKYGSNSDIYQYGNVLLKIFNSYGYTFERSKFEILSKFNLNNVSIPQKLAYINETFFGYSMLFKNGIFLQKINLNIKYDKFIDSLNEVEKTILFLSDNRILMKDLNWFNILYDESLNQINIVDIDNYREDIYSSIYELKFKNLTSFQISLFLLLFDINIIYSDKDKIKNIIYNNVSDEISLIDTFKLIKKHLESYTDMEIDTLKNFKKSLKKYYR